MRETSLDKACLDKNTCVGNENAAVPSTDTSTNLQRWIDHAKQLHLTEGLLSFNTSQQQGDQGMKTTFCLTLTLIAFIALSFAPNVFAKDAPPKYVVRTIYIVPNDREPDSNIDKKLNTLMKETQQFYADVMEYHGFGRKTFRLETDATGDVVVHHVNGKHSDAHYQNSLEGSMIVWDEIKEQFDTSKNIYVLALDISGPIIAYGGGAVAGLADMHSHYGMALVPASDPGVALWHELGHNFGLTHDSRSEANRWINPASRDPMITSFCAAEWMDVNRYFNPIQEAVALDDKEARVEMLKPSSASSPYAIRLQFKVTDPDGLHHAQLSRLSDYDAGVIDCKKLNGNDTTVEFVTTHVIGGISESVGLRLIDMHGNFTSHDFLIDITDLLPKAKIISIPDPNLASAVRETINLAPNDSITQLVMRRLIGLRGSYREITDLTGLEHAVNVQDIFLDGNQIRDLTPLEGATELILLEVSENPISDMTPLTKLKNLYRLSCRNAQISDIAPLARLTNLTELSLVGNPISDITPLAGLANLLELELGSSQQPISDIAPLAGLVNLTGLTLVYASIPDINPIARFTELTHLILSEVPINDIGPLTGLSKLTSLELTSCKIDDVRPVAGLKILEVLNLSDNQISDVSPLTELENLEELYLAGNPIKDTKPLRALLRKNPDVKIYLEYGGDPLLLAEGLEIDSDPDTKPPATQVDMNGDGVVNILDLISVASAFGNIGDNLSTDVNGDGIVNILDLVLVAGAFGNATAAPATHHLSSTTPGAVQQWLVEAKQLALTDAVSRRGIAVLEHLLIALTPKETALLANYPNPFNPETWIPYQLETSGGVTLQIYDLSGSIVRTIDLGFKPQGFYYTRSKAAYWDGRNQWGESVASGLYFYTLTAGDFTATRKMLILK